MRPGHLSRVRDPLHPRASELSQDRDCSPWSAFRPSCLRRCTSGSPPSQRLLRFNGLAPKSRHVWACCFRCLTMLIGPGNGSRPQTLVCAVGPFEVNGPRRLSSVPLPRRVSNIVNNFSFFSTIPPRNRQIREFLHLPPIDEIVT